MTDCCQGSRRRLDGLSFARCTNLLANPQPATPVEERSFRDADRIGEDRAAPRRPCGDLLSGARRGVDPWVPDVRLVDRCRSSPGDGHQSAPSLYRRRGHQGARQPRERRAPLEPALPVAAFGCRRAEHHSIVQMATEVVQLRRRLPIIGHCRGAANPPSRNQQSPRQ